jgi:hypothetical protein
LRLQHLAVLLENVTIKNFRSYSAQATIPVAGESLFVIAENAGGKTALLTGIARALGRDVGFDLPDFADVEEPLEIAVTLSSLGAQASAEFADAIDFGAQPTLAVGVRAVWNEDTERADVILGFPGRDWQGVRRVALRDHLPLIWLPSWRDPQRMLRFGTRASLLDNLFRGDVLSHALEETVTKVREAGEALASQEPIREQLDQARDKLAAILPGIPENAFSLGLGGLSDRDVLRQFELSIAHRDELEHFTRQSGGIQQLAMLVLALQVAAQSPNALLLVDEPETSLHPQAQRAFVTLVSTLESQTLVATHSSNVLDLADPRSVVRLRQAQNEIEPRRASTLTDSDAARLRLLSTPETAESFFSRATIFVEGLSDRLALRTLAQKRDRNLDADAVSIVVLHGAGQLKNYLRILGPSALDVGLAGLCDSQDEEDWRRALEEAGIGTDLDRSAAEGLGFWVCDPDLEGELIAAAGETTVEALIDSEGETSAWEAFANQPDNRGEAKSDLLRKFIHKRNRVIRYSPLIMEALDEASVPPPLRAVLEHV